MMRRELGVLLFTSGTLVLHLLLLKERIYCCKVVELDEGEVMIPVMSERLFGLLTLTLGGNDLILDLNGNYGCEL